MRFDQFGENIYVKGNLILSTGKFVLSKERGKSRGEKGDVVAGIPDFLPLLEDVDFEKELEKAKKAEKV